MESAAAQVQWVPIAAAHTPTEVILVRMLLNRACIPYHTKGEFLHQIYGFVGSVISGPVEFLIPLHLRDRALEALQTLFDIHGEVPPICPACDSATLAGQLDCPTCGLSLA